MNITERARWRGICPQATYRWSRDDRLPVPAVRVNARTALIGPGTAVTLAVPGGSACLRGSHNMTAGVTRPAGRLAGWAARDRRHGRPGCG